MNCSYWGRLQALPARRAMAKSASAYSRVVDTDPQVLSGKNVCAIPSVLSSCGT